MQSSLLVLEHGARFCVVLNAFVWIKLETIHKHQSGRFPKALENFLSRKRFLFRIRYAMVKKAMTTSGSKEQNQNLKVFDIG